MITVRAAKQKDFDAISEVFKTPELATSQGNYLSENFFKRCLNDEYFLVAEEKDEVLGAIIAEESMLGGVMIWFIGVAMDTRGKGIGSKLLKQIEINSKRNGIRWTILYAPILNKDTQAFYQAKGYTNGKEHIEYAKYL